MDERKMVYLDDVIKLIKAWDYSGEMHEEIKDLPTVCADLSGYSDRLWKRAYDRGYERCRQDAIDALANFVPYAIYDESTESYTNGLTDAYNLICQLPSSQQETFEWCHDCKEYDQEQHCCHRWSQQIRKTIEELEANYPQEIKDELQYWKERAAQLERDYYIKIKGIRKHVPNIDLEEVEEDENN